MKIKIERANEHNLKNVSLEIGDGLTVVTGVSGSGKTSLVFDTIYHEARRRYQEVFAFGSPGQRLQPARVESITGLGPAVAVGQNLLNRNPNSILATACGLHPFLRLMYARFGERVCPNCGKVLKVLTQDELVERGLSTTKTYPLEIHAPLLKDAQGSHKTLLSLLEKRLGVESLVVDGEKWSPKPLDHMKKHSISVRVAQLEKDARISKIREAIETVRQLGISTVTLKTENLELTLSTTAICSECGLWFGELRPQHFNQKCPHYYGKGCDHCLDTGLHPEASRVTYAGNSLPKLLALSVNEVYELFKDNPLPSSASRLGREIMKRLETLRAVGLGYISLDRPSPSLSRGESQRMRLAVALTSRLEDMLHVLDEPTIGQHPADVTRLLPAFRELGGPVIYVEHDRVAAAEADHAVDIGPGAGAEGGEIVFTGSPSGLWKAETPTGKYFSLRERVQMPKKREPPKTFLTIKGANKHNLRDITVKIPLGRLTVVTGVSGSGKSTLVKDVLVASFTEKKPVGCLELQGPVLKTMIVDQSPIGINPRSTPGTYTKLSDIVRDIYAAGTGLTASHFSFNRPEGACPTCNGMGAVEIKMRYLPSTWIMCTDCEGRRYKDEVLEAKLSFGNEQLSIADFYDQPISEAYKALHGAQINIGALKNAKCILKALIDIGLGYLSLGQPSPTLSGGEAQRVKLARYLGREKLTDKIIILDEPSTGLHPKDINGLLVVLDRLVNVGATVVVVEHNTDIIRAADWIIDLGPGAGPHGGDVIYMGEASGLTSCEESLTGRALKEEGKLVPRATPSEGIQHTSHISIRGARANNLKNINVDFPKAMLTVVTGVSGSGKSSLVNDVVETEAKRRYLETLSLYERQGTKEGPEAPVDSVKGLGVTLSVTPDRNLYNRRSTVGTVTEIFHHLTVLFSTAGRRTCPKCGASMNREQEWACSTCGTKVPIATPRRFNPTTYAAACTTCNGVGSLQSPRPEKLIKNPEKPLCEGAMHSPGFFPQGFLCKPGNSGYDIVQAFAQRHGFDPSSTPWQQIPRHIQEMFYHGDTEPLEVTFRSHIGRTRTQAITFKGFYGWIRDWDVGGTYTENIVCPACKGARLRPEYLAVTIQGLNIHELSEKCLKELKEMANNEKLRANHPARHNLETVRRRLRFLNQVGLGYIRLNRVSASLSAGEAQRVKLAGLLGSGLTNLTVLLDEPTRGLHPSEVDALLEALKELRDEGNTVIVVEHDPRIMREADYIIDVGPGPGTAGGEIVAQGTPAEISKTDTVTGKWLKGERKIQFAQSRRKPKNWLIVKGARENNLKDETIKLPLGVLVGVCGVSGSGKSTLMIDTIGRALNPIKHTTSVAHEPLDPGTHDSIEGAPNRTILVDQTKKGIRSPAAYLDLYRYLRALYGESEDAKALGLCRESLGRNCSACNGSGQVRIEMEFLPDIYEECETCRGTGYTAEAWDVRLHGYSLPELDKLTISQVYELFKNEPSLEAPLKAAIDVGLGYLVLRQPGYTLSGGEAQRLKIAAELSRKANSGTLYILDEPTVGQHMEDLKRLIEVLHKLVEEGNSVVVVEHHPHLLASCDWLIEMGPEGGHRGGRVVAEGTPENIVGGVTPTAPYLKQALEGET